MRKPKRLKILLIKNNCYSQKACWSTLVPPPRSRFNPLQHRLREGANQATQGRHQGYHEWTRRLSPSFCSGIVERGSARARKLAADAWKLDARGELNGARDTFRGEKKIALELQGWAFSTGILAFPDEKRMERRKVHCCVKGVEDSLQ